MPFPTPLMSRLKQVFGTRSQFEYVEIEDDGMVGNVLPLDIPVPGRLALHSDKRKLVKMSQDYGALQRVALPARKAKLGEILALADVWLRSHEDDEEAILGSVYKVKALRDEAFSELLDVDEEIEDADIRIPELTALSILDGAQVSHALIGKNRSESINKLVGEYNDLQPADLDARKKALVAIINTATDWLMDKKHVEDGAAKRRAIQQVLRSTQDELAVVSAGAMNVDEGEAEDTEQQIGIAQSQEAMSAFLTALAAKSIGEVKSFLTILQGAQVSDTEYHQQLVGAIDDASTGASALATGDFGSAWDRVMAALDTPIVTKMFSAIGIVLAAKSLKEAWTDRKALRATVAHASEDLLVAATYGLAKVTRRFYLVLKSFVFALAKGVMHLITVVSGGFAVAFTEAASLALTLTDSSISVGLAIKGAYKAWKGTRGKNRARYATAMVVQAVEEWRTVAERAGDGDESRPGPALLLIQGFGLKVDRVGEAARDDGVKTTLIQEVMTHLKSK
jgi:hypothetical protein